MKGPGDTFFQEDPDSKGNSIKSTLGSISISSPSGKIDSNTFLNSAESVDGMKENITTSFSPAKRLSLHDAFFGTDPYGMYRAQIESVDILNNAGVSGTLVAMHEAIRETGKVGLEAANDPKIVELVAGETALQQQVLRGDNMTDGVDMSYVDFVTKGFPKTPGTNVSTLNEKSVSTESQHPYENPANTENQQPPSVPVHDEVSKVSQPTTEQIIEMARAKRNRGELLTSLEAALLRSEDKAEARAEAGSMQSHSVEAGDMEEAGVVGSQDSQLENAGISADEAIGEAEELLKNVAAITPQYPPARASAAFTSMETDAATTVEHIGETLDRRQERSVGRLEAMGVSIKKGLDYYRSMKPRNKILFGAALAGVSVLSGGGAVGMAIAGVSRLLSVGSSSAGFYDKLVKNEQEKGEDPDRKSLKVAALAYGVVFSFVAGSLFSALASYVDTHGLLDAAGEKMSELKEGLKHFFGDSLPTPPSLPSYRVKPGDNLTKIFKDEVLSKIPGVSHFTDAQKENMFQNFLKYALGNKEDTDFDVINQFADPNNIQVDAAIDTDKWAKVVKNARFGYLDGKTLIENAAGHNSAVLQANIDAGSK